MPNAVTKPLNIIFAGTPDFAAQHLAALLQSEHNIVAVYCPPDKPAGRGKKLTACATKLLALENNIPVQQPENFKTLESQLTVASYQADVMVVVAYGLLLPTVILETPKLGCINVHGSILPKWRGAAPIQRALEAGDPQTGVTIMQMDKGLDTGDMILTATCDITAQDTSASLYDKLAELGPIALLETITLMASGEYKRQPQDNAQATHAAKLDKADAELNWQQPATVLDRKIRAYIPWPVAQFTFNENSKEHRIRVWQASVIELEHNQKPGTIISCDKQGIVVATTTNALRLEILQLPGKKALAVADILNGKADWFAKGQSINGPIQPQQELT
ncbi:methionyl-tRNA formyltransferase [Colwellia sp. PAMC 21821]|uniref:methionyl-tRNA formyltransferase n=1 Tax=Colwellia sp. PAMC 21821 TaxID=1816219 RepID=UPI0009BD072D|nr:methionyl-tRNA formyltransferase [Colwellia sp. PAMC 21821]ARD44333.1 methionyl-tRNA formyltransferase [Colwellia sp. PAMC 21821]